MSDARLSLPASRRRSRLLRRSLVLSVLALALTAVPALAAPGNFSTPPSSPEAAGDGPVDVAVGDFNGDGRLDQAVANAVSDDVTILLGDGSGGFTATPSPEAAGVAPREVAVGDFNGDGRLDLAVANSGSDDVTILLGDGSGGFTAATTSPEKAGEGPSSVAVGDFNGDGDQDLAVANGESDFGSVEDVTILLGDGSGDFTEATTSPERAGLFSSSVAVGDFNGDGDQDLAVADNGFADVHILLGDGTGDFTAASTSPAKAGSEPISVAVGDFNGDGKQDLATANGNSDDVSILIGDGSGNFRQTSTEAKDTFPTDIAVGDFNGDGRQDLALSNEFSDDVTILLGDGSGDFTPAPTSPEPAGDGPASVAVGDFNGDRRQDLAVANFKSDDVSILLNQPNPRPEADLSIVKSDSPDPATRGEPLTYTLDILNKGPGAATDATVRDPLPNDFDVDLAASQASQGTCFVDEGGSVNVFRCQLGTLASGASARVRIVGRPSVITPSRPEVITNTARVSADPADPNPADNQASTQTTVNPAPQCSDRTDNDADGKTDHPADPGCDSPRDNSESPDPPSPSPPPPPTGGQCNGKAATIVVATSGTTTNGTEGDDVILGSRGDDTINGRGGNDTICARNGNDTISGGQGEDEIFGQQDVDNLSGNQGADTLSGGSNNDTLDGGTANDRLFGGTANDTLIGGTANDQLVGGSGQDRAFGGSGQDRLFGEDGDDRLNGEDGDDRLFGENGNDRLDGGSGDDRLGGGEGDDRLDGGPNADRCDGGAGTNTEVNCEERRSVGPFAGDIAAVGARPQDA